MTRDLFFKKKDRQGEELAAAPPGHTRRTPPLSLSSSLLSFIHPSSISVSRGLASGLCSQVSFNLNPLLFISSLDLFFHLSHLSVFLPLFHTLPPSLDFSLSIAGSMCRSPVSVRPYFCQSVRQGGALWHWGGCGGSCPSLPARLVILSHVLLRTAHLWHALGTGAVAHDHPTFLLGLHQVEDLSEPPLSRLENREEDINDT